jgi:hypothetical protein
MANNVLLLFVSCRDPSLVVGTGWSWDSSSQLGQLGHAQSVAAACKFESVAWLWLCRVHTSPQSFERELLAGLAASPRSPSTAHLHSRVRLRTISRAIGVRATSSNVWPNML